jgi:hypothetical protein
MMHVSAFAGSKVTSFKSPAVVVKESSLTMGGMGTSFLQRKESLYGSDVADFACP